MKDGVLKAVIYVLAVIGLLAVLGFLGMGGTMMWMMGQCR